MSSKWVVSLILMPLLPLIIRAQSINEELLAAARKGNLEAVKALLAKGADANAKTQHGATPLSYAADRGHLEIVKALIEHGAEVNARDSFYNSTPITWAAYNGHAEVIKLLLDKGAQGKEGALMMAVDRGHLEAVRVILDRGDLKPETLTFALTRANNGGRSEIARLLEKAGAKPAPRADFPVDAQTLKSYIGVYKDREGREFTITLKDGKLFGGPTGQNQLALGAIDKVTFRPVQVEGVTITFKIEDGKVAGLTLKQGETNLAFNKVEEK